MILVNAKAATFCGSAPYGFIEQAAIAIHGQNIVWVGQEAELPSDYLAEDRFDVEGRLVTPGLIDCHTHLVHGGNRAHEFELRLKGATYEEIAREGGGIVSTVAATRDASYEELLARALPRVDALIAEGVCTVEIKSGYGLDQETEIKMLRVARQIGRNASHPRSSLAI